MGSVFQKNILGFVLAVFVSTFSFSQKAKNDTLPKAKDSVKLKYDFTKYQTGGIYLNVPSKKTAYFDKALNKYVIIEKVGNYAVRPPIYFTPEEYARYKLENDILEYYKSKIDAEDGKKKGAGDGRKNLLPKYYVNNKFFQTIFGGNEIEITPTGNINLRLGFIYQNSENPQITEENRSNLTLDFDQQISASLRAKVGERLQVSFDYDTQASFDFQNFIKLEYTPTEDDIIQNLEAGNVSMPIKNSLINGAQALFGVKADLQFGNTNIKAIFSQQNSESKVVTAEAGATIEEFELRATDYDNDRHFFLAQYFRDNYANSLRQYPLVSSQINITRVEVWITNRNATTEDFRSIVAFADIAESENDNFVNQTGAVQPTNPPTVAGGNLPTNESNNLSTLLGANSGIRDISTAEATLNAFNMQQGSDDSLLQNARKLEPSEYILNPQLGYLSLNRRLNDGEVLAVAYEYTVAGQVNGSNETSFKVGEFSNDGIQAPNNLAVKLLRSEILTTKRTNATTGEEEQFPTWALMMKNIYPLGAFPLSNQGFRFEVQYRDDETGIASNTLQNAVTPGIPTQPLIQVLNVDRLDQSQFVNSDGFFDYVEGITVNSQFGYVIFPEPEPFGENLDDSLTAPADKEKFVFEELYLNTKINIKNNFQNKDKFLLKGYYRSENAGGIPLNAFNVPRGSVKVTAGGRQLVEGVDFVVDYALGRVQITDPGLEASGIPIQVSVENNAVFNQQRKTFAGIDVEHKFSDDFIVGATILNVEERPLTPKVNYGVEPINNTMLGFTVDYSTEVPFFTKLANKLPFVDTDAPSNLSVRAEMAYLIPGTPDGIDVTGGATSYIDDFEASQVPISLLSPLQWFNASTPDTPTFPNFNAKNNDISYNDKRAKLAWYNIDQLFYGFGDVPASIDADELSRAETRQIGFGELFPNTELDITQNALIRTLDMAFFPSERGPYNFDQNGSSNVVDGNDIKLNNPETRWGGMMRPLTTNNFDQANVEYIQFWVMDPYENYSLTPQEGLDTNPNDPANQVGDLYINLGSVSEDINKDNLKMYENGLPEDGNKVNGVNVRESNLFGVAPFNPSIIYAFNEDDATRTNQDVGLDGLNDAEELAEINSKIPNNIYASLPDPAADNFQYYRGGNLDAQDASIISRYKDFNNTQGNSPTLNQSPEAFPTSSTTYPDVEDINRDQTMNTIENYYEYKISMNRNDFQVGRNFIVDEKITTVTLENGSTQQTSWYQFRVPVRSGTPINGISDFNSIRFIRMYLTNFRMPIVVRFGTLDLVRGDYRRYVRTLDPDINPPRDLTADEINDFEVGVISLEQNDGDYVLPPGIVREQLQGSTTIQQQNEQSVTLTVNNLPQNETRAIYKNISIDLRRSKDLKMFIHAQPTIQGNVADDDLVAILRLGTDLDENFYQIEVPLKLSPNGSLNPLDVWPEANNVNAFLENFGLIKLERDGINAPINQLYPAPNAGDPNELIVRVKGNPTLAQIRTVMLGVKNISPTSKSAEIWFNELRASGFDNEGGWAAVINADANFADVANLSVSGSMQTVGFGNVEDRISQRSLEENRQYNIATSLDLAKIVTPTKWGLQVPMSYSVGEQFIDPKFDPQYQDVELKDAIESNPNSQFSRDYTKRTSISFNNVKKNRNPNSTKKPRFYDVENVNVSYAHNQEFHRDYNIEQFINETVTAQAGYAYNFKSDFIEPFKNTKLNSKYFKLIKDFNFNPIPKSFALNSRVDRNFTEQQSRNLVAGLSDQPRLTQRRFLFDWDYTVAFDLTKSITLNFNATNSYIYDAFGTGEELQIFDDFFNTGRQNQYSQKLNATYQIPIDKVPFLSFVKADLGYTADFDWRATSQDPTIVNQLGNVVQNANTINGNAEINFAKLYKDARLEKLLFTKKKKGQKNQKNQPLGLPKMPNSRKKTKETTAKKILRGVYGVLTSVKTGKISYAENNGQLLPGYSEGFGFLGGAPTAFAFGSQVDIRNQALTQGWLVNPRDPANSEYFNKTYSRTHYSKLDYNFNVKPFKDLDIVVTGNRIKTRDFSQQLDVLDDGTENGFIDYSIGSFTTGNFSTSYSMVSTIFTDGDALFQNLRDNRAIISNRLAFENGVNADGFGANSQQVLLPAFLSAYGGEDANSVDTGLFKNIPIPNWTVRYNGLMKLKWFKKNFSNFVVTHGYKSSYTISNFTNNLQYDAGNPFGDRNASNNYNPELLITSATLVDEFSPLIKVDMKMKNSFSLRGEIKKDRTLTLNFNNSTLTDIQGLEYVFGFGYVLKNVKFSTRFTGKKQTLKGDINFRADVSLRDNLTVVRSIDTENDQISGGQKLFSIKFTADYKLNSNLTASFYYNHQTSRYAISTTFPRQAINAGLNIIYNLGQ